MKKLIKLSLIVTLLTLTGCESLEQRVAEVIEASSHVGNIEYHRTGYLTDSDLVVTVNEDGTRDASYDLRTKTPGGPKVTIKIEGIKVSKDDEEE